MARTIRPTTIKSKKQQRRALKKPKEPKQPEFNLMHGAVFLIIILVGLVVLNNSPIKNTLLTNENKPTVTVTPSLMEITAETMWLAPVGKDYTLASDYEPKLVQTNLSGATNTIVTSETKEQLAALFADAHNKGIEIHVLSGYRSYIGQKDVFNGWVEHEMTSGLNRKDAEAKANTYSAKPGQSEHQLGTAIDLKCSTCYDFETSEGNLKLYEYLKANAYKFGFVISYPDGKQEFTGYKPEPWHIRYVGIDYATELFGRGYLTNSTDYLKKFLQEKFTTP